VPTSSRSVARSRRAQRFAFLGDAFALGGEAFALLSNPFALPCCFQQLIKPRIVSFGFSDHSVRPLVLIAFGHYCRELDAIRLARDRRDPPLIGCFLSTASTG